MYHFSYEPRDDDDLDVDIHLSSPCEPKALAQAIAALVIGSGVELHAVLDEVAAMTRRPESKWDGILLAEAFTRKTEAAVPATPAPEPEPFTWNPYRQVDPIPKLEDITEPPCRHCRYFRPERGSVLRLCRVHEDRPDGEQYPDFSCFVSRNPTG